MYELTKSISPAESVPSGFSEDKEKLVIKKIYEFTHPDFDVALAEGPIGSRKRHEELRVLWRNKIEEIAREPYSILFYVSAFRQRDFQALAKVKSGREITDEWHRRRANRMRKELERDLERIIYVKEKLGRRFILLYPPVSNTKGWGARLQHIIGGRGIMIPDNTPIECFGEYFGVCVPMEAKNLISLLGFSSGSFRVLRELSLEPAHENSYGVLRRIFGALNKKQ